MSHEKAALSANSIF